MEFESVLEFRSLGVYEFCPDGKFRLEFVTTDCKLEVSQALSSLEKLIFLSGDDLFGGKAT